MFVAASRSRSSTVERFEPRRGQIFSPFLITIFASISTHKNTLQNKNAVIKSSVGAFRFKPNKRNLLLPRRGIKEFIWRCYGPPSLIRMCRKITALLYFCRAFLICRRVELTLWMLENDFVYDISMFCREST